MGMTWVCLHAHPSVAYATPLYDCWCARDYRRPPRLVSVWCTVHQTEPSPGCTLLLVTRDQLYCGQTAGWMDHDTTYGRTEVGLSPDDNFTGGKCGPLAANSFSLCFPALWLW